MIAGERRDGTVCKVRYARDGLHERVRQGREEMHSEAMNDLSVYNTEQ